MVINFTNLLLQHLNHVSNRALKERFENALMSGVSGPQEDLERVTICLEAMRKFQIEMSPTIDEKSDDQSETFREAGNRDVLSGRLLSALKNYNNSIALACPVSEKLALAYANRSIVLLKMERYEDCLGDIQRALHNGYPLHNIYKAFKRQGACYKALHKFVQASESFGNALKSLDHAVYLNTDMKANISSELSNEIHQCTLKLVEDGQMTDKSADELHATCTVRPSLSYGLNCEIPAASSGVQLHFTQKFGRHILAARNLEIGNVVMIEEPCTDFLYVKDSYTHCRHCCQRSFVLLPCHKCTWALFCSEECQIAANEIHKQECAVMRTFFDLLLGPCGYMAARVLFKFGVEKLSLFMKSQLGETNKNDVRNAGFTNGEFISSELNAIYHCHQNSNKRTLYENAVNVVTAALLVQCLEDQLPGMTQVAGILYRLCWGFCLNFVEVQELYQDPTMLNEELCSRGHGIYPAYSLLNHSCDPNIKVSFCGNVLVARVLQPIKQGAQLFVNYKYSYVDRDDHDRYSSILIKYHFDCNCEACTKKWPTLTEMPLYPVIKNKRELTAFKEKVTIVENLYTPGIQGKLSQSQIIPFIELLHQLADMKGGNLCKTFHKCLKIVEFSYARRGNYHHSQFM